MSMTMEAGPTSDTHADHPKSLIDRVPTQDELEALYGKLPQEQPPLLDFPDAHVADDTGERGLAVPLADRIDASSLDKLKAMFNNTDTTEAVNNEVEPAVSAPEPARSRFARLLSGLSGKVQSAGDAVGASLATAADRQQEKFEAAQVVKAQRAEQDEAYDSYAENIEATTVREQRERAEARQEKLDAAGVVIRRLGWSALTLPRRVIIETRAQYTVGKEVVRDTAQTAADTIEAARTTVVDGLDFVADATRDRLKQTGESIKNFFAEKAAAAQARKQARQAERARKREVYERVANKRIEELRAARVARSLARKATAATMNERAA